MFSKANLSPTMVSEKKLTATSTYDAFDEIYTNFDISVNETYSAANGYPFDYPTRWLNDPSMNKRKAIRRLDATPTSHNFLLSIAAKVDDTLDKGNDAPLEEYFEKSIIIDITEYDNLIKVMNYICSQFTYNNDFSSGALMYTYSNKTNQLKLQFTNSALSTCEFQFINGAKEFLEFLNQETETKKKEFNEVWNRDRLHFHASFSTSRRKFIGKRGDFYQNLSLLYLPPTNESTFYIRFTSNGIKNILLRYCKFDVQLCFIVNYKKAKVL